MTAFIGRDQELEKLKQALEGARQSAGSCWMLGGEPGIGKSRLVDEVRAQAASQHFEILQGNCFPQDASFPYAPWIDALRMSFASSSPAEIKHALGPLVSEINKLLPELRLLIPDVSPNPPLDPAAEKYRLFESLARLLLSANTPRSSLIILEDLQWSDSLSLELLHFLARRIPHLPVVLIATYRGEESSPHLEHLLAELERERLAEEMALQPLDQRQAEQLIRAVAEIGRPIPISAVQALLALTDGNLLFLEETVKSLAEEGHIDKLFQQGSLDEIAPPRSIQRLEQQRAGQLSESTRRVLQLASVIGQRLDFELLQEISGQTEQELLNSLRELIDAHLVVQESADQFAFRHALTRQAMYSMLMLRERKAMHQAIGDTLERLVGTPRDTGAAQLAYHFYQAGAWDKAMEYSRRAGEQALILYAPREAFTHFTRGLDAAQHAAATPAEIYVQLYFGRAQAREAWDDLDGARSDYEAALQLARRASNAADEWQTLIRLGLLLQSRDLDRAGEILQHALELARQLGDASMLAESLNRVGNWHTNCGHGRAALPLHQQALELLRQLDDRGGMARTMELLGITSYQLCDVVQGAAYLEQAAPIFRELDDRQALVSTLAHLAWRPWLFTEVLGDTRLADLARLSDEALQIARGSDWYQGEMLALINGAICLKQAGDYRQALQRLSGGQRMLEESRNRDLSARMHAVLGEIFIELLAIAEAEQHLERSLAISEELGSGLLVISARTRLAQAAILRNDPLRAQVLLSGLIPSVYPAAAQFPPQRGCWSTRAELELAQGNPGHALEILDLLIASTVNLEQFGPYAVPRLSQLRGQALAALGRLEEAEAELKGTLPVASRQGQRPLVWRLHRDLGGVYRLQARRQDAQQEFALARSLIRELSDDVTQGALRDNFLRRALAMLPPERMLTARQSARNEFGGLTAREREIAGLIAQAKSNREIADDLVISEKTTERHISNILGKLGFSSRTQIAVWAVEKGLRKQ